MYVPLVTVEPLTVGKYNFYYYVVQSYETQNNDELTGPLQF